VLLRRPRALPPRRRVVLFLRVLLPLMRALFLRAALPWRRDWPDSEMAMAIAWRRLLTLRLCLIEATASSTRGFSLFW